MLITTSRGRVMFFNKTYSGREKERHASAGVDLLTRQIYQTGILFGFFVSILSVFINASIFVKS